MRCSLQYTKTAYVGTPVVQCANHSTKEADFKLQGHVLRSNTCGVEYDRNEHTGHYSILFPYDIAQGIIMECDLLIELNLSSIGHNLLYQNDISALFISVFIY